MIIRCLDLETTGLAPPEHTVIELGWADLVSLDPETHAGEAWAVHMPHAVFVDLERAIPPEASAIHHIVEEDLDRHGTRLPWLDTAAVNFGDDDFLEVGETIVALCAHNAKFERQWCTEDLTGGKPWICTYKCALRLWPDAPNHQNQTLRYWLNPKGLRREFASEAHRAGPDAYVTAFLLREMLRVSTTQALIQWSRSPALLVKCHFGKHRGALWRDVPLDYLHWASRQDFDEDVKFTVAQEIGRRKSA